MELISKISELNDNIRTLAAYLLQPGINQEFARGLIRNGICFVVTELQGKVFFAPSRFVGYRANTRHDHLHNEDKDGRETNGAIADIVGRPPTVNERLAKQYDAFCSSHAVASRQAPFGIQRKFWDLR